MEAANAVDALMAKRGFQSGATTSYPKKPLSADEVVVGKLAEGEMTRPIRHHNPVELPSKAYTDCFGYLKAWVDDSLDIYKHELEHVLFPLFVHCYLDLIAIGDTAEGARFYDRFASDLPPRFSQEITRLHAIASPLHLHENELVQAYRQNKYNMNLSTYAFQLLMSFIHEKKLMLLIKLLNQYIKIHTSPPGQSATTTSLSPTLAPTVAEKVLWGSLPTDPTLQTASDERRKRKDRKNQPWTAEDESEVIRRRKQSMIEREENGGAANAPPRDRIPMDTMVTEHAVQLEIEAMTDLRYRVALSRHQLPSACCYTFHNTHGTQSAAAISNDSQLIATGYTESFIHVHSLKGERVRALRRGTELPDIEPTDLITNEEDGDVSRLYDLARYREIAGSASKKLIGHSGPVYDLSFSPDMRLLMSASADGTARAWSLDNFTNLVAFKGHNSPIWSVDCAPHMPYFATGSLDRTARLWRYDHISPLRIFVGHLSDVDVVKFHVNSNYLATGSSDKTVRLWDNLSGKSVQCFQGHDSALRALCFSPDGKMLATAGDDCKICVWDLSMGKVLKELKGHEDTILSLSFSQDGNLLTSGSMDNTVRMWDVKRIGTAEDQNEDLLATFMTKSTPVLRVQYTRRNVLLVAGSFEGVL